MKRIAVKIGSNVLTRRDGTLDFTRMSALVDQVAELHKRGIQVVLVSSGAVASGRSEIAPSHTLDEVSSRQLYSAIGQAKLMGKYYTLFREHGITCGQVLTTKEGLDKADHYVNQQRCMEVMLAEGVIPIVNENDTLSITELMFTDNDELSGLMAQMMQVDQLVILSNIDGIYDGNPADPQSRVIRSVSAADDMEQYIQSGKSSLGRGGMLTKCHIARKVAAEGIPVVIANGKSEDILLRLIDQPGDTICTRFQPLNFKD
ncbi:MAG: glutamate 5-kinase [Bacteroidaceae bacterium]|nr:glutamate 5-kinase [Bacteroidaceae bacterium]